MPKDLAKLNGISGAAISQWIKPLLKRGVLMWVDEADNTFADVESLEKAKRSGKAYIKTEILRTVMKKCISIELKG